MRCKECKSSEYCEHRKAGKCPYEGMEWDGYLTMTASSGDL